MDELQIILGLAALVSTAIAIWSKVDARLDIIGDRLCDLENFLEQKSDFQRRKKR